MMKCLTRSLAALFLLVSPAMAQTASSGPWANALGTVNDASTKCYAGTGAATIPSLLCGLYNQAITYGQKAKASSISTVPALDLDIAIAAGSVSVADAASTTTAGQNSTSLITGTPTASSSYVQSVNGQANTVILVKGTWVGTLQFEGSSDSGVTYSPRATHLIGTGYTPTSVTGNGMYLMNLSGLTNFRVRATAWTSGTATIQAETTATMGGIYVLNPQRLIDGASGNQATIKAPASTLATDPALTVYDAQHAALQTTANGYMSGFGTAQATSGAIAPVTGLASSVVCKAAAGNLYSSYATDRSGTASFMIVLNQTAAPSASGAITAANILDLVSVPANGTFGVSYGNGPAKRFGTGIVTIVSTSVTTFTAPSTVPFLSASCL